MSAREVDWAMRRTRPHQLMDALVHIWGHKGFPEGFDAGDAARLVMKGWVEVFSTGGIRLTASGLAALNLAEAMYEKGQQDGPVPAR